MQAKVVEVSRKLEGDVEIVVPGRVSGWGRREGRQVGGGALVRWRGLGKGMRRVREGMGEGREGVGEGREEAQ